MAPTTLGAQRGIDVIKDQASTPPRLPLPTLPTFLSHADVQPLDATGDLGHAGWPAHQDRTPRRGDIWFVSTRSQDRELGSHRSVGTEIWSNKLAVVISNDKMNDRSGFVQIVYLSTSPRRRPNNLHVRVDFPTPIAVPGRQEEAHAHALAFCEQVHAVDSTRLERFYGEVLTDQLDAIDEAIAWSLDLR